MKKQIDTTSKIYAVDYITGKVSSTYESISDAARRTGFNKGSISRSISGKGQNIVDGKVFIKVHRQLREGDFRIIQSVVEEYKPTTLVDAILKELPKY